MIPEKPLILTSDPCPPERLGGSGRKARAVDEAYDALTISKVASND